MNRAPNSNLAKADRLFQQAFMAHQAGRFEEAVALYERALQKNASDVETLYLLGTALSQQSKFEQAKKYFERAVKLNPRHPEALNNLGLTLRGQRKSEEAIAYYRKALQARPDYADAHCNLASVLEVMGRLDEAEQHVLEALRLNPQLANAHYTQGLILLAKDRFEEAAQCFIRGLQLKPDFSAAYNDLGGIYKTWGRIAEALRCFDRALELDPAAFNSHNNRGAVYEELGRYDDALAEYEIASSLNPVDQGARWNMAFLFLRQGILDRGWQAHETRLTNGIVSVRFSYPVWDGGPLEGKTLLIYAEQGLGDEIMFASCVPDLIARGAKCVIECDKRLEPLFQRSFPAALVRGASRLDQGWLADTPPIHLQIAAGSLPRLLRPTIAHFPETPHYLVADADRTVFWKERLAQLGPGLKVGICWRSGLVSGERHRYYSRLTEWGDVLRIPGVHFVNLQYGECEAELREAEAMFGVKITNFSDINLKDDIDDSASLMAGMDLVISAATAVSEIAGSLGVESIRLNSYGKQWEVLGRTDIMPWHPKTRLFDQTTPVEWETTLSLVAEALKEKLRGYPNQVAFVRLHSGVELAVPDSLDDCTAYVLREQAGWFEPEYEFLCKLAGPGTRIVDLGAGTGQYAVPLSARAADGLVMAFTTCGSDTDLLLRSRRQNGLEKEVRVALADAAVSLDLETDRHGLEAIDLVRVAHGMAREDVLSRGEHFFSINSPLVMIGVQPGDASGQSVLSWFSSRGYQFYRLVPGLDVLAPVATLAEQDVFTTNLFACKQDRAQALERAGCLLRQVRQPGIFPGIEVRDWQHYLHQLPYAAAHIEGWTAAPQRPKDWQVYWMALNLYAISKKNGSAEDRHAALHGAYSILGTLLQESATLPRLLTFCRILTDLGRREAAVNLLNQIGNVVNKMDTVLFDEPFLALSTDYESIRFSGQEKVWLVSMVLEQRERLRAFSGYFTGKEGLAAWSEIREAGIRKDVAEHFIRLIAARFGMGQ